MAKLHNYTHTQAQVQDEAPGVSFGAIRAALVCMALVITVLIMLYMLFGRATNSQKSSHIKHRVVDYYQRVNLCMRKQLS
jgi:hypothetical protein